MAKMPSPEEVAAMLESAGPGAGPAPGPKAPPEAPVAGEPDKNAQLQELATQLQDIAGQISALLAG